MCVYREKGRHRGALCVMIRISARMWVWKEGVASRAWSESKELRAVTRLHDEPHSQQSRSLQTVAY